MDKIVKQFPDDYTPLLIEVKERIRNAQYQALKAVNKNWLDYIGILANLSLIDSPITPGESQLFNSWLKICRMNSLA